MDGGVEEGWAQPPHSCSIWERDLNISARGLTALTKILVWHLMLPRRDIVGLIDSRGMERCNDACDLRNLADAALPEGVGWVYTIFMRSESA
jgi:hypothetical protein